MFKISIDNEKIQISTDNDKNDEEKLTNEVFYIVNSLICYYRMVLDSNEEGKTKWNDIMENVIDLSPEKFKEIVQIVEDM